MVVDPRRDHGLRVPRPDLSAELGVPEPCTACHTDRSPSWAADRVAEHFGAERTGTEFARAFSDAREGDPRVVPRLAAIVGDAGSAGIVRATAASLLGQFQHPDASPAIDLALRDADPLVRLGGLDAVTASRASTHWRNAFRLLSDSLLAIRVEAARALAPVPPALLSEEEGRAVGEAIEAYVASQLVTADRPETHLNIGAVLMARGELERAEQAFARAIELDPTFGAGYVNAADLYRSTGRESDALAILVRGLEAAPEEAALHHALGLALVRQQRVPDALIALSRASELEPENGRFAFVYAIGLNSTGEADRSLEVMTNALESSPYDRELLSALVTVARDAGHVRTAISYAQRVAEVWAFDPTAAELLQAVTGARP
jgi:Flp pilus assembly protein TadD